MMLLSNTLLIDGITRGGKSLVGLLLRCIQGLEKIEKLYSIEHIISGTYMKKIDPDFSLQIFQSLVNEKIYDNYISRNINFRAGETTSVKYPEFESEYLRRLHLNDGDSVLQRIELEKPTFPFITHEMFFEIEFFLKNFDNLNIVEVLRDPFDIYFSWLKKDWGARYGTDKRAFRVTFEDDVSKENIPWYLYQCPSLWKDPNTNNRVANTVSFLTDVQIKITKKLLQNYSSRFKVIIFEDFTQNPLIHLSRIKNNYNFRENIESILAMYNFPREPHRFDESRNKEAKSDLGIGSYQALLDSYNSYADFVSQIQSKTF
jgi:hypothetical protein